MNSKLQSALAELGRAGAKGLTSPSVVEVAKDGSTWSGKKSDGGMWSITKNSESSYNCMC